MKKLKTSVFRRSSQLLSAAGKIASHEITQSLKNSLVNSLEERAPDVLKTRIQQAKILTENLSQLKGAAMKVGQLLSIDSTDLIPPEVSEILSQLQSFAEPVDFAQVRTVLEEDVGRERLDDLHIDSKPFSAASIGQVHVGEINGRKLAIKIQYPGVRESIGSDLAILKKMASTFLTISRKPIELDGLFIELRDILLQETDYIREMNLLNSYSQKIQDDGLQDRYIVPKAFAEFSTSRVLVMSFEDGVPLKEWLAAQPSRESRDHIARLILDLYCREFFEWGLVQTDPNYGNFLVRDDRQLVLLDFGAAMNFERTFIENYRNVLKTFGSFDDAKMIQASIDFNLIDPREGPEARAAYVEFMKTALEPFLPHMQPFRFDDPDYTRKSVQVGRKFTGSLKYSPPPKHIIFLHRKLGGIFNLLRKMGVQMNLTPYWEKMIDTQLPDQNISLRK